MRCCACSAVLLVAWAAIASMFRLLCDSVILMLATVIMPTSAIAATPTLPISLAMNWARLCVAWPHRLCWARLATSGCMDRDMHLLPLNATPATSRASSPTPRRVHAISSERTCLNIWSVICNAVNVAIKSLLPCIFDLTSVKRSINLAIGKLANGPPTHLQLTSAFITTAPRSHLSLCSQGSWCCCLGQSLTFRLWICDFLFYLFLDFRILLKQIIQVICGVILLLIFILLTFFHNYDIYRVFIFVSI